ncbi:MAG: ISAs1 family transposase [Verrucomicrobiota bacterium]
MALKGNQGQTHQEVKSYLDDAISRQAKELAYAEVVDKGHGRLEVRRYWQSGRSIGRRIERLGRVYRAWVWSKQCARLGGQRTVERRYYLSSLSLDVNRFARAYCSHWSIENQLHWVLDVNFNEDQSRARSGYASENLATLRRWALNLIKTDTQKKKRSLKGRMKAAGWDNRVDICSISWA